MLLGDWHNSTGTEAKMESILEHNMGKTQEGCGTDKEELIYDIS